MPTFDMPAEPGFAAVAVTFTDAQAEQLALCFPTMAEPPLARLAAAIHAEARSLKRNWRPRAPADPAKAANAEWMLPPTDQAFVDVATIHKGVGLIEGRLRAEREAAEGGEQALPSEPAPQAAAGAIRTVTLKGKTYQLVADDAPALFGALAMAVDGGTARITLASGDVLDLTHQEVSDLGRQLAGKPADEVFG